VAEPVERPQERILGHVVRVVRSDHATRHAVGHGLMSADKRLEGLGTPGAGSLHEFVVGVDGEWLPRKLRA
jgi:hypothetical protein